MYNWGVQNKLSHFSHSIQKTRHDIHKTINQNRYMSIFIVNNLNYD